MNARITRALCAATEAGALTALGLAAAGTVGAASTTQRPGLVTAYVANAGSDTVTPILATGAAGQPIKVGTSPLAIAITPNGRTAYVVSDSGTVTPISTATNTAGKPIKVGGFPLTIAITPNGKTAYVPGTIGAANSDTVT